MTRHELKSTVKKIIKKMIFFTKIKALKQNHLYKYEHLFYRKTRGHNTFTIILSVYNVEVYLNDFFTSIINQTLTFEEHINIIVVNDGSTDNSEIIIKRWQTQFLKNIIYLHKLNGGLSSARNFGLNYIKKNHIKTDWIGFIDPDDFIHFQYFEYIDTFLQTHNQYNVSLISTNLIFYFEKTKQFKNTHPLKYKFKKRQTILPADNLENFIQLSAATAFLNPELIFKYDMYFHEDIKPNFEDAYFINLYLQYAALSNIQYQVVFLKDAKYFYRKRADESSTLDGSWQKKERYNDVLKYGYLDLLEKAKNINNGLVPKYIQRVVLYHLVWYFKYLINNEERVAFLNHKEISVFKKLLGEIFSYIEIDTIYKFDLADICFYHKLGWLHTFKNQISEYQVVYIDKYDQNKNEILLRYYYHDDVSEECFINDEESRPRISKIRDHKFLGEIFVYEKIIWLPLTEMGLMLKVNINSQTAQLSMGGREHKNSLLVESIIQHFKPKPLAVAKIPLEHLFYKKLYTSTLFSKKFKNAWMLMDRDIQADDNAEHLYRYISKHHPEINLFFLLRKDSFDWNRLEDQGFNLIAFDSHQHKALLVNAVHNISSHADHYVINYLPNRWYKDIIKSKYTFLQHGVTHNNLSRWLSNKQIDCFITAAQREYDSIASEHTSYKFTNKEVCLTGFPRHDALLLGEDKREKLILIMPTWRKSLMGKNIGTANQRELNPDFHNTQYFKAWSSVLHSEQLLKLSQEHNYKIIFSPHANIQPYLETFNVPDYIETLSHHNGSMQKLFQRSALMITDYSSVAFEMGILQRETIYYQFDHIEVFSGEHTYQKGYFDYEKDGFGPVCYEEKDIINELELLLQNDGNIRDEYLQRIEEFFTFHDTNNCQRVFDAIKSLDHF